ncbi:hypothetical protein JRO89_XS09G0205600 [Xanthoceras sorbifolium]|uniref:Uncharacterized protein n=1 Tax=Xanthoceras sorbifolium TaxID=99658 RepID=A0ABQ8HM61_9ROSI|nr:hypothetical protein JRO89_XS09G0205600 [Xanthoceras sorbifolium]
MVMKMPIGIGKWSSFKNSAEAEDIGSSNASNDIQSEVEMEADLDDDQIVAELREKNDYSTRVFDMGDCKEEQLFFGEAVWKRNCALQFSKESNNLYNLNSFKHSGHKVKLSFPCLREGMSIVMSLRYVGNVGSSVRKWMSCEAQEGSGVKRGTEAILCILTRLANAKTVTIEPGKDQSVVLATSKTRNRTNLRSASQICHEKGVPQDGKGCDKPEKVKATFGHSALGNNCQIFSFNLTVADNRYRPDLKKAALARLSAVNRSLRVSKSGAKKRNRQAVRIRGRK